MKRNALFVVDKSGSISVDSFRDTEKWMNFEANLWVDRFDQLWVYAGDSSDLKKKTSEQIALVPVNQGVEKKQDVSGALDRWAIENGKEGSFEIGFGGGDVFKQMLMAIEMVQSKIKNQKGGRLYSVFVFSDFYDLPCTVEDMSQIKSTLGNEYFKEVNLVLCSIERERGKESFAHDWVAQVASSFASVQVVGHSDFVDSKRAYDEARELSGYISGSPHAAIQPTKIRAM